MKTSDIIADSLKSLDIDIAFVVAGGMITHLLDSFAKKNIRIINNYHEQASAFCVFGASKATNSPFIALATSGPGATNLLTGIGSCYFDSVPSIFITGQVNTHEKKENLKIRQLGFQETDICSMAKPITKAAYEITENSNIYSIVQEAYKVAISGRPGPVLIDIPMNIQSNFVSNHSKKEINPKNTHRKQRVCRDSELEIVFDAIQTSRKPLILAGRGISCAKSNEALYRFIQHTRIPVVKSLLGIDTYNEDDNFNVGFIGSYGNRWANIAIGDCDLLIVMGSRLDIRQTGARLDIFDKKKIIHIDIDSNEINNRLKNCIGINSHLANFLYSFESRFSLSSFEEKIDWINEIHSNKKKWPSSKEQKLSESQINPNTFIELLSKNLSPEDIAFYSADVGSHQMWVAQSLVLRKNQRFITCGGMGAMGSAIPAAIGASLSLNKVRGLVFTGDGSVQMNIQELQTIVHHKLPITIIIFNNRSLGMIRQFQDSYFESNYQSTVLGYSAPDFVKIGEAYGIKSIAIENSSKLEENLKSIRAHIISSKPLLIEVQIPMEYNALPKIAFGRTIKEMEPQFKPEKMEST